MPTTPLSPVLVTEHLRKCYGSHVALDDLNLTVHRGEVFGYIGPNGAGKTTTFRILSGLLSPTSGKTLIAGQDVTENPDLIKRKVGFLPDNFGVYPTLRVWEYLEFFAAAYKIPRKQRAGRVDFCLQIAKSMEFKDKLMGALSRGMKQRVGIAKTLLHDPEVLILDEPAATLDPRARVFMRELLRDLANLQKGILVSSHILPELAEVCDTIGILSGGKMIACGKVAEILRQTRQSRIVEIHVLQGGDRAREILAAAPGQWRQIDPTDGNSLQLRYEVLADEQQLAKALFLLMQGGLQVVNFAEIPADLEDAFMNLTQK